MDAGMNDFYDYKRYAILYVDDEEKSLKYFTRAFGDHFRILTATNARDAFQMIEASGDDIGILMTDQRMPEETGVELLDKARTIRPRMIRILATAYSDLDAAIDAVNTGSIYKYVSKPWDIPELETTLKRGLEFFIVQHERDQLMKEKLSALHNLMIADRVVSLGVVAAGLGHYVRNALVAVRTFLDLAPSKLQEESIDMSELRNPNFWKDFYGHVQNQVQRIGGLLGDLSEADVSSDEFGDEIQLAQFVADVIAGSKDELEARNLTVENQIPDELPSLKVNRAKFERLFQLFIRDETVSLAEGKAITIGAETETNDGAEWVKIQIRDNGAGLPEDELRQVFDPFFVRSGDPKEFGINLMTCYFIVYHHGGKVDVQVAEGGGTCFNLRFPTGPQPAPPPREDEEFVSKVLLNEALWDRLLAGM
jgi:two-component system probable response regulator PhcQ